jgi:hypothetical protein
VSFENHSCILLFGQQDTCELWKLLLNIYVMNNMPLTSFGKNWSYVQDTSGIPVKFFTNIPVGY